jgi:hypothetical protein
MARYALRDGEERGAGRAGCGGSVPAREVRTVSFIADISMPLASTRARTARQDRRD